MNKLLLVLLLLTSTLVSAGTFGPQTFKASPLTSGKLFVSPTGTGTTCSIATPCSIWSAIGKAEAGNVVFLRGGTYIVSKNINFYNIGKAGAPITYESYPGEYAVFNGQTHPKGTNIAINVSGKFISLRNFEVKNMPMQGFWVQGTDNTFDKLHVPRNEFFAPY